MIVRRYFVDGHSLEAAAIPGTEPNLPTMVLLHEGLGSVAHWKDFPQALADETGCGVFLYSRYGHGQSDALREPRTPAYMHQEAQKVLPDILRQAQIERPVLLGQSDGASIALIYASLFPNDVSGLILEAPHVFVEDVTVASIAEAGRAYRETNLPHRLGRYHADADALFWGWNNIWLDPAFRVWNIEALLDSICCPVLVIQGADDEYGTLAQVETIRQRMPVASALILDRCGHAPHRDQRQATLSAIRSFLRPQAE